MSYEKTETTGQKFKTGDVVTLRSGGPTMTVNRYETTEISTGWFSTEEVESETHLYCIWYEGSKREWDYFHQDTLELLEAPKE